MAGLKTKDRSKVGALSVAKLCQSIQQDRLVLRKVRENRRNMVAQLVGRHWSEFGSAEPVLDNQIAKYVSIVGRLLIANDPRYKLTADDPAVAVEMSKLEGYGNRQVQKLRLANVFARAVLDSLFSIGCVRIGLATPADAALASWGVAAGQPFADPIDLDDLALDTHARTFDRLGYVADRIRLPFDVARKMFGSRARDLEPTDHSQVNAEGDEKIDVLFRGYYSSKESFEDMVDVWHVYLPRHRKVLYLTDEQLTGPAGARWRDEVKPLEERAWVGPANGPYYFLSMMDVPGNLWPKAPVQDVFDIHLVRNEMLRKLTDQSNDQKIVLGVRNGKVEDAKRIGNARDREIVQTDTPLDVYSFVGPDQGVFNLAQYLDGVFNRNAGNLDLLGGLAPESGTARQDTMLNQNAGRVIGDMQDRVTDYVSRVGKGLFEFWHYHPHNDNAHPAERGGISWVRRSDPAGRRTVPFDAYDVRVDPYSLKHKTPEERLASIQAFLRQDVLPVYQLLQQKGRDFDFEGYAELTAELLNEPRIKKLMMVGDPPAVDAAGQPGGGEPAAVAKPASTTREYVRRSQGGGQHQQQMPFASNGQATGVLNKIGGGK